MSRWGTRVDKDTRGIGGTLYVRGYRGHTGCKGV